MITILLPNRNSSQLLDFFVVQYGCALLLPASLVWRLITGVRLLALRHALAQLVQRHVDGWGGEQGRELHMTSFMNHQ